MDVLKGVGDKAAGQWEEQGVRAVHIRRRLTAEEQASIGDAVDCRGQEEGARRLLKAQRWLAVLPPHIAMDAEQEVLGVMA